MLENKLRDFKKRLSDHCKFVSNYYLHIEEWTIHTCMVGWMSKKWVTPVWPPSDQKPHGPVHLALSTNIFLPFSPIPSGILTSNTTGDFELYITDIPFAGMIFSI